MPNEVQLKINSIGTTPLRIVPPVGAREGTLMITSDGITALYATNPGSVDMDLLVITAGED